MKTVYILGAGFSLSAGVPAQQNILKEAFRIAKEKGTVFDTEKFKVFKNFMVKQLFVPKARLQDVALEDIFTPLDRCLSDNSQYRGIGLDQISAVREAAFHVIGQTIRESTNDSTRSKSYIESFAAHLVQLSSVRTASAYRTVDPVSVLSTNWDTLLDNSIHGCLRRGQLNGVVDYCCHISSRDEADDSVKPGLEVLGGGGFNVKLIKLHGSLNWLQCPRCMRLYARFSETLSGASKDQNSSCRHCDGNFPEEEGNHKLASNLIMPTFTKDLSNPQYRIIWQNAGIELSEADKLVFIGYSLPSADFEMRQLLSRMTRKNAEILVVDFSDMSNGLTDELRANQDRIKRSWKTFFGSRSVEFNFNGAASFVEELTTAGPTSA